jgi:hypothetical protein
VTSRKVRYGSLDCQGHTKKCRLRHIHVNKFWNNKFYYKVASCWLFLLIHITMHGLKKIKNDKAVSICICDPVSKHKTTPYSCTVGPRAPVDLSNTWQAVRTDTLIPLSPREEPDLHVHIIFLINCMQIGSRSGYWYQRQFRALSCWHVYV